MNLKAGIDFGTSNSGVAVYDGHRVKLLSIDRKNTIPEVARTILYINRDHHKFIGQEAVDLYYRDNVNRQRHFVKQWAGEIDVHGADMHFVRDVFVYVDELRPGRLIQYLKTALRKDGYTGTQIFDRFYKVGELVQIYLSVLKHRAEEQLGEKITAVTLGRPVKFSNQPALDDLAEQTLFQAAHEAGFAQVKLELEPVAAALDYEQSIRAPQNVVVFDFGGGTLDIAVLRVGDPKNRRIYASGGVDIAGSDFDRRIIKNRLLSYFGAGMISHQPEIIEMINSIPDPITLPEYATLSNQNILHKAIRSGIAPVRLKALDSLIYKDLAFTLYNRVESAKIALSEQGVVLIDMEDKGLPLWEIYTRTQFENDILKYVFEVKQVLLEVVQSAGFEPRDIDAVIKTGGSSNIPIFHEMLRNIFGADKVKQTNSFTSVVAGLAIRANS